MVVPRQGDIDAASGELDKVTRLVEEGVVLIEPSHVRSDDAGKVARPFRRSEIVVVTSRDDVDTFEESFVDPFLVLKDVLRQTATEPAIQDVIATIDRLPHSFTDDDGARTKVSAQNPDAANLRIGRDSPDHARYSG